MLGVIQELLPAGKASGWTPQGEGGMLAGMTSRTLGLAVEGRTGWNMSDLEDKVMQALFSGCAQEAVRARIDEETHGMRQRKHELSDLEARAEREEAMLQASEREPEEIGVEEPKPEAGGERESGSGTEGESETERAGAREDEEARSEEKCREGAAMKWERERLRKGNARESAALDRELGRGQTVLQGQAAHRVKRGGKGQQRQGQRREQPENERRRRRKCNGGTLAW